MIRPNCCPGNRALTLAIGVKVLVADGNVNAAVEADPLWGWVFLIGGILMIVWDLWSSWRANQSAKKLEEAKEKVGSVVAKLDQVQQLSGNFFGVASVTTLTTTQSMALQQLNDAAEEAKTEANSAKASILDAFDTALQELAKAHSKLVVGAGLIVLAAGAFGAPIPFVG